MNPVTHLLLGWAVANIDRRLSRKERAVVTLAGVVPDLDGLGLVAEIITHGTENELLWWSSYHHAVLHNLGFGLVVTFICWWYGGHRVSLALWGLASFHVHLIGDLIGARAADGDQWPITYLMPFSDSWSWVWKGQWELNAWPNFLITGVLLVMMFYWAWKRDYSPLEMVSVRADRAFVKAVRSRLSRAGQ